MKLLQTFVATPLAGALGWTLLHSLWQGAIVASTLAAALLPVRSSRIRYAAACLAMVVMFAAFGLTLVRTMPPSIHVQTLHARPWPSTRAPIAEHPATQWESLPDAIVPWLAPFWIAGVLAFYLRQTAALALVYKLRRNGVCCATERWQKELGILARRMRLTRPVLLLESCFAETPVVLGHLRPVILMPVGLLAGLPAAQIEAILLHELAHVRRHDYIVNVLQRIVEGVLFYHPAVWWISRVIRAERENCCDDLVVSIRGDAREYAYALAALEQNRHAGREPALAATGGNLVTRIRRLLYPRESNGAWAPVFAALVLIATTALTIAAWQVTPLQASPQPGSTLASPFTKWLEEDVVYIIDDAERAAFLKLTTDDERNKFIEQFWERRNPVPGSSPNPFKEEHYRRIAFANEHFAATAPGWRTDRGHMYIIHGPPDELEAHPTGQPDGSPTQDWLYRHLDIGDNVVLHFVDRSKNGDYRLAPAKIQ